LNVAAPEGVVLGSYIELSPSGRQIAVMGTDGEGKSMIYIRALDAEEMAAVPGTEGGRFPFWSPDGTELAFYAGNKLQRVNLTGGSPQTICDSPEGRGGSWSASGTILFAPDCCSGLFTVPASGGTPTPATLPDVSRGESSHRWPQFLPDGRHFLFAIQSFEGGSSIQGIYVGTLGSSERKKLRSPLSEARFEAPDSLFFVNEGRLLRQKFDLATLSLVGDAVSVAEHVGSDVEIFGLWSFSTAKDVVAYRGGGRPRGRLTWFDRGGRVLTRVGEPGVYATLALSPDDRQVGVARYESSSWRGALWLVDTSTGRAARFTFEDMDASAPIWSGDGGQIYFPGTSNNMPAIYRRATGGGAAEVIFQDKNPNVADDVSRDGHFLVYEALDPKSRTDLWLVPLAGDHKPRPFLATAANESDAKLSPDGKWLAYTSDAVGQSEVFVQPFPDGPGRWQVSTQGGREPTWRRDGKELYFLSADRKLMAAAVHAGVRFEAGPPEVLFSVPFVQVLVASNPGHYAVSGDGQRILISDPLSATGAPITILISR
jgi:dipeptidyl aminopeptidase/acylaminoacyl peptidase